ncbi:MAG: hypothetical protein MUC83_01920 [Pirellula sp.]|nr:hypothetical protein [Pirellula sp.]
MNSDRHEYLKRIDQLLLERNNVANYVESGLRDIGDSSFRDLKRNIAKLKNVTQAEQLLASGPLIRFLPLLNSSSKRDLDAMQTNSRLLFEQESKATSGWRRALSYPSVMFMAIFGLFLFQAIYVSPPFESMFAEFELRLPYLTEWVLAANKVTRSFVLVIIPAILLVHVTGNLLRYCLSLLAAELQKLHVFDFLLAGRVSNLVAMSRFMRILAELVELGTPLHVAISHAGVASQHAMYRLRAEQLAASIQSSGTSLEPWEAFPAQLSFALRRDINLDRSARLLREFANTYGNQASLSSFRHSGATSPWLVLLLGAMMFILVIALFAPLIELITSLSGGGKK